MEWSDAQTAPSAAKPVHINTSLQVALQTYRILASSLKSQLHKCPQSKLPPTKQGQKQGTLCGRVSTCMEIHASLLFCTHTGLFELRWTPGARVVFGSRAARTSPYTAACGPWFQCNIRHTGRCQRCRRRLAAVQTIGGDSPGDRSSPNKRWQCSVAFGATCDVALSAHLLPPLPGPWQLDILPSVLQSRDAAHRTSFKYCSLFSPNEHMNLILPPYYKPRIRNYMDLIMDFDASSFGILCNFLWFFFQTKPTSNIDYASNCKCK